MMVWLMMMVWLLVTQWCGCWRSSGKRVGGVVVWLMVVVGISDCCSVVGDFRR